MPIFYAKDFPDEHKSYEAMKERCFRKNHPYFLHYGGRGIGICDRWLGRNGFKHFMEDMGPKPSYEKTLAGGKPIYSLDRIDVNGDYCPENCRWATLKEQGRNKSNSIILKAFGMEMGVADWSKKTGIKESTIYMRIGHYGMSPERALSSKDLRRKG